GQWVLQIVPEVGLEPVLGPLIPIGVGSIVPDVPAVVADIAGVPVDVAATVVLAVAVPVCGHRDPRQDGDAQGHRSGRDQSQFLHVITSSTLTLAALSVVERDEVPVAGEISATRRRRGTGR